jgi:hypothetical protein
MNILFSAISLFFTNSDPSNIRSAMSVVLELKDLTARNSSGVLKIVTLQPMPSSKR